MASLHPSRTTVGTGWKCKPCLDGATCDAKYSNGTPAMLILSGHNVSYIQGIVAKEGYWRVQWWPKIPTYVRCGQNPKACLGAPSVLEEGKSMVLAKEECKANHEGPLCGSCSDGYWRDSAYICKACGQSGSSYAILASLVIVMFAGMFLVVLATIKDGGQGASIETQIFQIWFNHAIIMSMSMSISYQWPSQIKSLLTVVQVQSGFFSRRGCLAPTVPPASGVGLPPQQRNAFRYHRADGDVIALLFDFFHRVIIHRWMPGSSMTVCEIYDVTILVTFSWYIPLCTSSCPYSHVGACTID